jgi:serine/threonine protein kinase/tetratricopeptide (TPR) repeat protein
MAHRPEDIEALAREAARLGDADQRKAFLDRACAGDPELREAVERRLALEATFTGGGIPSSSQLELETMSEQPGSIIGPYRLIEILGQGGFGTVFLAEQEQPMRREVALKIIKLGMDTREVISRFEAERQALAMMDHPSIARVFDAGTTRSGRPYFVMELVRGKPITRYCDDHALPLRDRLQLFNQVCAAVQHAHQKGIIHRDIKPSNVLVTEHDGVPVPKVIDFGIAKATDQGAGERSVFTSMGQIMGTPAYMSPEQAGLGNLDIDTRSDVYSLGVLLYELLTGTVPFDVTTLRGAFHFELQRIIREQEPPKPSSRVTTAGATLRGDLDWIVMRALEKDRSRRYESARELASDVERHLRDEPVTAGPPSASYRMQKFIRRHKASVGTAVVAVLVLVAFAATMAVQARRIATERDRANREREISDRVADFQTSMLQRIRPFDMGASIVADLRNGVDDSLKASFDELLGGINPTDTARRVLDAQILSPAVDAVTTEFKDQPETEVRMRLALSRTYRALGVPEKSLAQAERAAEVSEKTFGPENRKTLLSRGAAAIAYWELGRMDDCEKILAAVQPVWAKAYGPDDPDAIRAKIALGVLTMGRGRDEEAQRLFEETLASLEKTLGPDHKDLINPLENLATSLMNQSKVKEAAPYLERSVAIRKSTSGAEDVSTLTAEQRLAEVYVKSGRPKEGEALQKEALATLTRVRGETHPVTIDAVATLGVLYRLQGRFPEAEATTRQALGMKRSVLGGDHLKTLVSMGELAQTLSAMGRLPEAEALFQEALERARRVFGPEAPVTCDCMSDVGTCYQLQGRYEEAERIYEQVLDISKRTSGEESDGAVLTMTDLALVKARIGRLDEAFALNQKSVEIRTRTFGPDHRLTLQSMAGLADVAFRRRRFDEAEKILVPLLAGRRKAVGADDPSTFETWYSLAKTYERLGRNDEARTHLAELFEHQQRVLGKTHAQTLDSLRELGRLDAGAGRIDDARKRLAEVIAGRRAAASAADATPLDLDACAKLLLMSEVEDLRDPKEALAFSRRANEQTKERDPVFLQTLAMAWFNTGDRARAIETQTRALARLSAESPDRPDVQAELARYKGAK